MHQIIEEFLRKNEHFHNGNYSQINLKMSDYVSSELAKFPHRGIGDYYSTHFEQPLTGKVSFVPYIFPQRGSNFKIFSQIKAVSFSETEVLTKAPDFQTYISFKPEHFKNANNLLRILFHINHISLSKLSHASDHIDALQLFAELKKGRIRMDAHLTNLIDEIPIFCNLLREIAKQQDLSFREYFNYILETERQYFMVRSSEHYYGDKPYFKGTDPKLIRYVNSKLNIFQHNSNMNTGQFHEEGSRNEMPFPLIALLFQKKPNAFKELYFNYYEPAIYKALESSIKLHSAAAISNSYKTQLSLNKNAQVEGGSASRCARKCGILANRCTTNCTQILYRLKLSWQ